MTTQPKWKRIIKRTLPFIQLAGEELEGIDDNDTGPDDVAAKWISYTAEAGAAILEGHPIPLPPIGLFDSQQIEEMATQAKLAAAARADTEAVGQI